MGDMSISDSNKLSKCIKEIQLLKLGLGSNEFQTLRGVWSLCSEHSHIEYSASLFIKLWKKYYIPSQDIMSDNVMSIAMDNDMLDSESNDDVVDPQCMGCGGMSDEENFLLCDNGKLAKHGCHIYCLDPPLIKIPNNDWFCPKCDGSKHIDRRCNYCNSQMYDNAQSVIECINKKRKKKKCERVCHAECAERCNDLMIDSKWRCPECLGKISPKFEKKQKKSSKVETNSSQKKKIKQSKIYKIDAPIKPNPPCKQKRKKSQFEDSDSEHSNDLNVQIDDGKIPKIKFKDSKNKMINVWMSQFLQVANDKNVNMKRLSIAICKCLLQRSNDLSKALITKWMNEHRGSEQINEWLLWTVNQQQNIDSEKLMLDIFGILHKIKEFAIEWAPNSQCLNIISSIIHNQQCFDINSTLIQKAKECKLLFDKASEYTEYIRIKLKNYPTMDWHEVIYGKYGSIKLEYAQKYEVDACINDQNGNHLKPGFVESDYSEICIVVKGMNQLKISNAVSSYKCILNKLRRHRQRKKEEKQQLHRERTPSVKVRDIEWLRVKSLNTESNEIEYYFWNKATNETSWDAPKHWKEYENDDEAVKEDVFATKELLKLAEEMKEESMDEINKNKKEKKRKKHSHKKRERHRDRNRERGYRRDRDRNHERERDRSRYRKYYSDRSRNNEHKDRRRNYRKHNDRY